MLPLIATILAKAFTTAFQYRMKIVRTFQEKLSEIGMGLFILTNVRENELRADFLQMMEVIIKAYVKFITTPCIYSRYGEEIIKTRTLNRFFSAFSDYKLFKQYYNRTGKTYKYEGLDPENLKKLISLSPFPSLENNIDYFILNPQELFTQISKIMHDILEIDRMSGAELAAYIDQHFNFATDPIEDYLVNPDSILLIHPTIDLDWAVIKTYITLYITYVDYYNADEEREVGRYHLWHGTRNIWAIWEENGKLFRKLLRGSFKEIAEHTTKETLDFYKSLISKTNYWDIYEYYPRTKRYQLKIDLEDFINELKAKKVKEFQIFVEHEGIESNAITLKVPYEPFEPFDSLYGRMDPAVHYYVVNYFKSLSTTSWFDKKATSTIEAYNEGTKWLIRINLNGGYAFGTEIHEMLLFEGEDGKSYALAIKQDNINAYCVGVGDIWTPQNFVVKKMDEFTAPQTFHFIYPPQQ